MRRSAFVVAVLLATLMLVPTASATQREETFEFNLNRGTHKVIPIEEEWKGEIKIDLRVKHDKEVDLYIISGDVYNGTSKIHRVFENVTDLTTSWKTGGNFSIVVDNLDNPSEHDATGNETVSIEITIIWSEDIPADPFMTAFCCGGVLIFVIVLFYIFVRFFLRKPPRKGVRYTVPGPVERTEERPEGEAPRTRKVKPPAPTMKPKTPPGPKWPPDDGPERGT